MNIWIKLKKEKLSQITKTSETKDGNFVPPILVLAPMADVTDIAFRSVIAKYGKPDVLWTEFVSADGLMLAPDDNPDEKGFTSQDKLRADLKFTQIEKPIVAQIFGSNTKNIYKTAKMLYKIGFDGVDINMGCPDRSIEKQGSGSGMIKNPKSALNVIRAAKNGVGYKKSFYSSLYLVLNKVKFNFLAKKLEYKLETNIPITVKTRLGYNKDEIEKWIPTLLSAWPAVITIHARTRKQMSKVPADWSRIKRAVEIRDEFYNKNKKYKKIPRAHRTLIFGNGDVKNKEESFMKSKETSCDGVMIGRGIFGNPWLFGQTKREDVSIEERLKVMVEHTKIFEKELPFKNFAIMKKHYKAYVEGFDGAKELRVDLMEKNSAAEVEDVVNKFISNNK